MTIALTLEEEQELWDETAQNSLQILSTEPFENYLEMPKFLGNGYEKNIELHPKLWLKVYEYEYREDMLLTSITFDHPLQFGVLLSGVVIDECGYLGEENTFISGGGIQKAMKVKHLRSPRSVGIDIEMSPDLLATFFPGKDGEIPPELKLFAKENEWQTLIYPAITPAMRFLTQQIFNCPYWGMTKRIYLQAKVLELIALQLSFIFASEGVPQSSPSLKSDTIARIHHAKQIIHSRLDNPLSLTELAALVGLSDRTLRRGFKELFGTTVFSYLTAMRMEKAERYLRERNMTVAEVANLVGYAHLGHFAAAFKRKYGIAPSECSLGKKSVSGL
ncbi:MAG: AraC family transcriptional regulator [Hydrococcus sp. Prado102]|jgi:AraC-like DNA-binding protein|nr:AraC family transcriptional regulator [Hydrococcus sp. Prado102]